MDENLDLNSQVQSASGKARSAQNKINILLRGRRGIPLEIAINLYKALVRSHWEHAIAAWSVLNDSQVGELEKVQASSLKSILGVFKSSSNSAVEVIANVVPVRVRMNEICCREWIRIMSMEDHHPLKKKLLSDQPFYEGNRGSPLGYMKHLTRDLQRTMEEGRLSVRVQGKASPEAILDKVEVQEVQIFSQAIGNSKSRSKVQSELARSEFDSFYEGLPDNALTVFTDGSVLGAACIGRGGYGVVIHRKNEIPQVVSGSVGRMTDNVSCEVQAIIVALKLAVERCVSDRSIGYVHIFTDCQSAIDIFTKQKNSFQNLEEFRGVWECLRSLKERGVPLNLIWVPGHADITGNEKADRAAKNGCLIPTDSDQTEFISEQVLFGWVKEKSLKRWGEMWRRSESGNWTRFFLGEVGKKLLFPQDRDTGVTYVRALLNNAAVADNMFRMGLADSSDCSCGEGRETVEHLLMECSSEAGGRGKLLEEVGNIWMEKKVSGGLQFNLHTILNPFSNPKLNSADASFIMNYVFIFLRGLSKKL